MNKEMCEEGLREYSVSWGTHLKVEIKEMEPSHQYCRFMNYKTG
jgi:hypothetical protein